MRSWIQDSLGAYIIANPKREKSSFKEWLTVSISDYGCVLKSNSYGKSKDHEYPVYFWDVDLPIYMFWRVHNFDSWKAAKGMALFDDGESSSNNSLTTNNCCQGGNNKDRPEYSFCKKWKDRKQTKTKSSSKAEFWY